MLKQAIILGLVAEDSPISGIDNTIIQVLILAAIGGVAAYLVNLAAKADASGPAFGMWFAGLVPAAAVGYLAWLTDGVPLLAAAYLLFGGAAMIFMLPRPSELPYWIGLTFLGGGLMYVFEDGMVGSFALLATVSIVGALKTIQSRELVHSAIWLASVLVAVAGVFLVLGAPFLAVIQLLVYVGAVITLILFTVMLTVPVEESHFLDDLELPPGITIESVTDLDPVDPTRGQGPMKAFDHPRKPTRMPDTLYGVSIADGVFGTEYTERKPKKEGS